MKIREIKDAVAGYLDVVAKDLPDPLLMASLNAARLSAERRHDFRLANVSVEVLIDPVTGGDLNNAILRGSTSPMMDSGDATDEVSISVHHGIGFVEHSTTTYVADRLEVDSDDPEFSMLNGSWGIIKSGMGYDVVSMPGVPDGVYASVPVAYKSVLEVVRVKTIVGAFTPSSDGTRGIPIQIISRRLQAIKTYKKITHGVDWDDRYPSDHVVTGDNINYLVVNGSRLFLEPQPSKPAKVLLDACRWMPSYSDLDQEDFFCLYGHDYLMWAAIVDLNHRFQRFAYRQEGTLPPPEKFRDTALQDLMLWDSYVNEEGARHEIVS